MFMRKDGCEQAKVFFIEFQVPCYKLLCQRELYDSIC